ncbi:NlpC/P60 family protein [Streptomyces sp. CAU 1734]|uniref:C40 family peptidase n=1 Tax=Streptomyces sp. CAU 1734 TaxID=3140360 RepID=UPI0032610755
MAQARRKDVDALVAVHRKHRKPRQYLFGGSAARTAGSLALAGAATATAFSGTGHAEPALTPAQIRAEADRLYQEAGAATQRYNSARERTARAQVSLNRLRDEAARGMDRLNSTRNALGSIATAQYRAGGIDPGVRLALTSDPDEYLARASLAERVGDRQAAAVREVRQGLSEAGRIRAEAGHRLVELEAERRELARQRSAVRRKLARAEQLVGRLTPAQRAVYNTPPDPAAPGTPAPNPRAARAVAHAYGALGKPYVWGATGPGAYDCSGLTQAAWRAAGVSLPRTTYTQIDSGRRIERSALAPGDLVFFYPGITHVGLYIGDGKMIHAPRPGVPIRIAPIDEMPFAGATRPV